MNEDTEPTMNELIEGLVEAFIADLKLTADGYDIELDSVCFSTRCFSDTDTRIVVFETAAE